MQEAEELEARALAGGPGASKADRDDEIKPFVHKCAHAECRGAGVVQRCRAVLHAVHGWQEQGWGWAEQSSAVECCTTCHLKQACTALHACGRRGGAACQADVAPTDMASTCNLLATLQGRGSWRGAAGRGGG